MFSIFWVFVGFLVGLLITSVFAPPLRKVPRVPTPHDKEPLHTQTGCVKFSSQEVPCGKHTTSLNFIASQR